MSNVNSSQSEPFEIASLGMMLANQRRKQGVISNEELVKDIDRLAVWLLSQIRKEADNGK